MPWAQPGPSGTASPRCRRQRPGHGSLHGPGAPAKASGAGHPCHTAGLPATAPHSAPSSSGPARGSLPPLPFSSCRGPCAPHGPRLPGRQRRAPPPPGLGKPHLPSWAVSSSARPAREQGNNDKGVTRCSWKCKALLQESAPTLRHSTCSREQPNIWPSISRKIWPSIEGKSIKKNPNRCESSHLIFRFKLESTFQF